MMLPSRLDCPLSLKTPNMGNPGLRTVLETFGDISGGSTCMDMWEEIEVLEDHSVSLPLIAGRNPSWGMQLRIEDAVPIWSMIFPMSREDPRACSGSARAWLLPEPAISLDYNLALRRDTSD